MLQTTVSLVGFLVNGDAGAEPRRLHRQDLGAVVREGARVGVLRLNADKRALSGAGVQAGVGLEVILAQPVNAVPPLPVVQHQVQVSLPRRRIGRVRPGYQTPHQGLWRPRAAASPHLCVVFVRLFARPLRHLCLPVPPSLLCLVSPPGAPAHREYDLHGAGRQHRPVHHIYTKFGT